MTDLVERVARAMWDESTWAFSEQGQSFTKDDWQRDKHHWIRYAKAAIAIVLEETAEKIRHDCPMCDEGSPSCLRKLRRKCWLRI
jgi:hypothetical protein